MINLKELNKIDITETELNLNGLGWQQKKFANPNATIRIGTTFSGIGAIEYAFKRLSLKTEIMFAGDINENCRKSYFANYDIKNDSWHTDIHDFNAKPFLNKIDLLVGGAPCQAFSIVGNRLGFEDTRGTLFREFARVIKECKPKVFIFENVQGLYKHDKGKTWEVISNTFREYCGYHIFFRRLNSKNYGIPQNRLRWYGVGIRNDIYTIIDKKNDCFHFPEKCDLKLTLNDLLDETNDTEFKVSDKCLDNIKLHLQSFKESNRFNPIYPLIATEIRPSRCNFRCDGISPCLTAKMGTGGNNVPVIVSQSRKYTVKECFQLMGFPDWYRIEENKMQSYKQIGNSVVVPVVNLFIEEIARLFEVIKNE